MSMDQPFVCYKEFVASSGEDHHKDSSHTQMDNRGKMEDKHSMDEKEMGPVGEELQLGLQVCWALNQLKLIGILSKVAFLEH